MEVITLADGIGKAAIRAAGVLRHGGVVVYPTDTLYGIGVDSFSNDAVDRLYAIKGREAGKPTHCIVADLAMAEEIAEVNDIARKLAEKFLPGPLTLILKKKPHVQDGISRGIDSIGIRVPKNDFCFELARTFGKPVTTPSANRAGGGPLLAPADIIADLGEGNIDLFVDAGVLAQSAPSTVVNLISGHPSVLREGAIPARDVLAFTQAA
jgi:L-threonylcarbamoyladenylate synthase